MIKIEEKPNFNQLINAGFYFVEKKLIKLIPRGKKFDADQWIKLILKNKLNVQKFILYLITVTRPGQYG